MKVEHTSEDAIGWKLSKKQKMGFIKEMEECGAHVVFHCSTMVDYLTKIGLDAEEMVDGSLRLYNRIINLTQPEWGDPGIYAPTVLTAVIDAHGLDIKTEMLGRGFAHTDRLTKLALVWL